MNGPNGLSNGRKGYFDVLKLIQLVKFIDILIAKYHVNEKNDVDEDNDDWSWAAPYWAF